MKSDKKVETISWGKGKAFDTEGKAFMAAVRRLGKLRKEAAA